MFPSPALLDHHQPIALRIIRDSGFSTGAGALPDGGRLLQIPWKISSAAAGRAVSSSTAATTRRPG